MTRESRIDAAIERLFSEISFQNAPEGLYDPLRYMIAIGGKRLRPRLMLTTCSLFRNDFPEEVLAPAAGLEVFHTFTLIHDDIMDRSPLRRGHDTVWKKWDPDTAILSGDVMCIDSYKRIAKAPAAVLGEVLALFSKTAAEVCDGQQYDMEFEKSGGAVSMDDYLMMIGLKTGVLIACAAQMGVMTGGAPREVWGPFYDYGYNLGLAFQIADDWLDCYGDSRVFGKPIGGDIVNGKKSWLAVKAAEKAPEALEAAMAIPVEDAAGKAARISAVMKVYEENGVGNEAMEAIGAFNEKALAAIAPICCGDDFALLKQFADSLTGRSK